MTTTTTPATTTPRHDWASIPWTLILNVPRRRLRHGLDMITGTGLALVLTGTLVLALPLALAARTMPRVIRTTTQTVGTTDQAALDQAADYDRRLARQGATAIGEAPDPFAGDTTPAYQADNDYQRQLGPGPDMAAIRIPRISLDLPIGHGTGPSTLDTQAGHIYGTTLPVGDPGNTVIAAHRGLGLRELFYRLGELTPGDMIYTQAAGRTTAWRTTRTLTVDPGSQAERDLLAIPTDGQTILTLYTCDPPGLNTRRLIIQATKTTMPDQTRTIPADPTRALQAAGTTIAGALTLYLTATPRAQPMRHATRRHTH